MIVATYKCWFCDFQGQKSDVSRHEKMCRQKRWEERNFAKPRDQCEYCRWEGLIDGSGESYYHCLRHWEMPNELKCCEGWETRND